MPNVKGEMSEDELLTVILGTKKKPGLAPMYGWKSFHARPAQAKSGNWITPVQGDGKGFFDLVLVRDRILFVELKSQKGKLSTEQAMWQYAVASAMCNRVEVLVWRPSDLPQIQEILK